MYKSFEQGLFDKRTRLQRKIRKEDIKKRIAEKRSYNLAITNATEANLLVEGLPRTLNQVASQLTEKDSVEILDVLVERIDLLVACLVSNSPMANMSTVCFVLTDLLMKLDRQSMELVVNKTIEAVLCRALHQLNSQNPECRQNSALKYLAVAIDGYPVQSLESKQFEMLCLYVKELLIRLENDPEYTQQLICLIQQVLREDDSQQVMQVTTKLTRKRLFIDVCFAKEPVLLDNLFRVYMGSKENAVADSSKLQISFLTFFLNLTFFMAPDQEGCVQNHQVTCLLQKALFDQSQAVVILGVQILHNFLYFDRDSVQQINSFRFVTRLLRFLKEHSDDKGYRFIAEVLSTLSKYVLAIDPLLQGRLMHTFLADDGLQTIITVLCNSDIHEYEHEATFYCVLAIQKLTTYVASSEFKQQNWKILLSSERYFEKLMDSDCKELAKAAEELLQTLK